jgi:hypothetical protein
LTGHYTVNDSAVGIAFISDPWGTYIEINERPAQKRGTVLNEATAPRQNRGPRDFATATQLAKWEAANISNVGFPAEDSAFNPACREIEIMANSQPTPRIRWISPNGGCILAAQTNPSRLGLGKGGVSSA